jgi:hypothetical protein
LSEVYEVDRSLPELSRAVLLQKPLGNHLEDGVRTRDDA